MHPCTGIAKLLVWCTVGVSVEGGPLPARLCCACLGVGACSCLCPGERARC